MAMSAAQFRMFDRLRAEGASASLAGASAEAGTAGASGREPRELAALGRATEWLNSPRLTAASLLGQVVLVDFCTYTCINWLRTLPYVRAWAQKYRQGLVADRRAHTRVRHSKRTSTTCGAPCSK